MVILAFLVIRPASRQEWVSSMLQKKLFDLLPVVPSSCQSHISGEELKVPTDVKRAGTVKVIKVMYD